MRVKVSALSFSKSPALRKRLQKHFPDVTFNETGQLYQGDELISFLRDADAALVGGEVLNAPILEVLPQLKILSKYGVGMDNIDLEAAQSLGKEVAWTPGVNRDAVAEQSLGLMIGMLRNLFSTGMSLKQGVWNKQGGQTLFGKTVGIIGCGHIGSQLMHLLQPFQVRLLVCDILDKSEVCSAYHASQVNLDRLLAESDVVSLHVPLTSETRHMINQASLQKMKVSSFLINTSRGAVVCQNDLKQGLKDQQIAGAALDVFEQEPCQDEAFLRLHNLFPTPHIAGNALEAVLAMGQSAIDHLVRFHAKMT